MLCIYYSRFLFGGIVGINVKLITVCFWINASFAICYNDFACRYWGGCSLGRHYWDSGGSVRSSRVYFYCLENQVGLSIYPYHHTCISYCALKFMLRETFIFFFINNNIYHMIIKICFVRNCCQAEKNILMNIRLMFVTHGI